MHRLAVTVALAVLWAGPALAEDAPASKAGAPGTNVEMPFLIAPMSSDGKLLGYAYISSRMVATSQSAAIAIREKLAFIQDAFVRDVNARPIGRVDDPKEVDLPALNTRLVRDARRIVGQDKVDHMVFTDDAGLPMIKFAPLHPGDSTLNLVPPTERAPAGGPSAGAAVAAPAGQPTTPADSAATSQPEKDSAR